MNRVAPEHSGALRRLQVPDGEQSRHWGAPAVPPCELLKRAHLTGTDWLNE